MERKGPIDINTGSFGVMDDLSYDYQKGNQLAYVSDTSGVIEGFNDGNTSGNDYLYDENGNMIVDKNKDITNISYNHLNLPNTVAISNSEGTGNITYIYDATGVKQKKVVSGGSSLIVEYAGNHVYENGQLKFFNHAEGYIEPNGEGEFDYVYQYKDHLGNIRLSFSDKDKDGKIDVLRNDADADGDNDYAHEILQEKNYYPFGLKHKGYNHLIVSEHNYGFGGKEENDELGLEWMDFGARNYDPSIARWMNMDPLADNYVDLSPYNYVANSPLVFIDPDGQRILFAFETDDEGNRKGEQAVRDNINSGLGGGDFAQIDKNGNLSINISEKQRSKLTKGQATFLSVLEEGINATDTDGNSVDVNINVVENSTRVGLGAAKAQTIDIADINSIGNSEEAMTQHSVLAHEVKEQVVIQSADKITNQIRFDAHKAGEKVEEQITGYTRGKMDRSKEYKSYVPGTATLGNRKGRASTSGSISIPFTKGGITKTVTYKFTNRNGHKIQK